jgi:peptide-methionine (S)-S-oxide reductase
MKLFWLMIAVALLAVAGTRADESKPTTATNAVPTLPNVPPGDDYITVAAGCFWCTEAVFQQVPGVVSVTSGYMGGTVKNPTYHQVCTGTTGHAEASRIVFDPKKTSLEKILSVFWEMHDPTSLNRQGADTGTQYRSAIFYNNDEQKKIAEQSKAAVAKEFSRPIVTEITKAGEFYPAEDYHQDYYNLNKDRNPYCRAVISPKLKKLGMKQ